MIKKESLILPVSLFLLLVSNAFALDADDLEEVIGYTVIGHTYVSGEFEGADYGKLVKLDNGMIFEFREYSYSYSYRPSVAIFAKKITPEEMRKLGLTNIPDHPFIIYKLVIDDEMYDVSRIS
jgi:hypothetical protein